MSCIVHSGTLIEDEQGAPMSDISADLQQELDELRAAYKAAVDAWVKGIREEEDLASATTMSPNSINGRQPIFASISCTEKPTSGSAFTRTLCAANSSVSDSGAGSPSVQPTCRFRSDSNRSASSHLLFNRRRCRAQSEQRRGATARA